MPCARDTTVPLRRWKSWGSSVLPIIRRNLSDSSGASTRKQVESVNTKGCTKTSVRSPASAWSAHFTASSAESPRSAWPSDMITACSWRSRGSSGCSDSRSSVNRLARNARPRSLPAAAR